MNSYLVLENGRVFPGQALGAQGVALGELAFTTGMTGYQETLTDPSYYGQLIVQTFPLIGNYGMIPQDAESDGVSAFGYVVHDWCRYPSNFRAHGNLHDYLFAQGIIGISGLDTRQLTRIIREQGAMNSCICPDPTMVDPEKINAYSVTGAVAAVSRKEKEIFPAHGRELFTVALLDYGAKRNIIRSLCARGCKVIVLPYDATAEEVLASHPDGIMLSNGPGDPMENVYAIREIAKLIGKVPMFGICLGHQLMALALGGSTIKMKYGHRGANQPVLDKDTGRTLITAQNHGYAVSGGSIPSETGYARWINANDQTCEGMMYPGLRAFSLQFHPEACSGPRDAEYWFDRFLCLLKEEAYA